MNTFRIGGDLPVHPLGFGAMRLTGWGPPEDPAAAIAVARRAVELGVTLIDTADAYALGANEELLAQALHPYPRDLVIATKAGQSRPGRGQWKPLGRPEYLIQQAELSLRRLRLERIELFQLHRVDPQVPFADQIGALAQLRDEGKIRHIGLSEVGVAQIEEARRTVPIASVQNRYNLTDRRYEDVLDHCEAAGIAFIPWQPVADGTHAAAEGPLARVAKEVGGTPVQVMLAWLLARSPVMLPIPGTSSAAHLEENMAATRIELTREQFSRLDAVWRQTRHTGPSR
ncbi:aldo/keto reductase [Streptosporangium minutum]|uniref:Oxidoreductase n=1 Tax=Streptosporangium minutum TaxID=569862 RepID=A0A243RE40_9ACTN|nr:aldo/keto reductase [Streptosporangium minutum]OUC92287.1 oxidoreductase [Streptosporangium minutum]